MARKTVLVTGASRGIGKAIAVKFAKKGYNVAISCVHSKERLLQTQKEIQSYQVPCLAYMGDMGDMECCEEWFEHVKTVWRSRHSDQQCRYRLYRSPSGYEYRGLGKNAPCQSDLCL